MLPILKTQEELMNELANALPLNCGLTDDQFCASLSRALQRWGDVSKVAVDYESEVSSFGCEVTLPCEGMDSLSIRFKSNGDCHGEGCWKQLNWWDVVGDSLVIQSPMEGTVRVTSYANQPEILLSYPELSKGYVRGNRTMWIKGRVELPTSGWVRVCGEWHSYVCYAHVYNESAPVYGETLADPGDIIGDTWDESIFGADVILDPGSPIGLHTVLENVRQHPLSETTASYSEGDTVYPGFAVYKNEAWTSLIEHAIANSYHALMTCCTRNEDRDFYREMMNDHLSRSQGIWTGASRKPQIKYVPNSYRRSRDKRLSY